MTTQHQLLDKDQRARWRSDGAARVAVIIPCRDEEAAVADVVTSFRAELPGALIYVCDNSSSDSTAERARAAGAVVVEERLRGKGRAVRTLLREAQADIYLLVDGDGTYPAAAARLLVAPILSGEADMAVGSRWHSLSLSRSRALNRAGNLLFLAVFRARCGNLSTDVLSGYRAFSRRFIEEVSPREDGFGLEAELSVKAALLGLRVAEVPVDQSPRPRGGRSKIRPLRDGLTILRVLLRAGSDLPAGRGSSAYDRLPA